MTSKHSTPPPSLLLLLLPHCLLACLCTANQSETALLPLPPQVPSCSHGATQLFVFGDSELDVGTNNHIRTRIRADFAPYGQDFIPASGRFSNGRLVTDYLASFLGIPTPPPFLADTNGSFTNGVNFASAGAGIMDETSQGATIPISQQLKTFQGLVASNRFSPEDLFDMGARKLVALSVAANGCDPVVTMSMGVDTPYGCNLKTNDLHFAFSTRVSAALASPLFPFSSPSAEAGTFLVVLDQYSHTLETIQNLADYGFDSLGPCCGAKESAGGAIPCDHVSQIQGGVSFVVCPDANRVFYWDSVHGSEKEYEHFAQSVWSGGKHVTPPGGLASMICNRATSQ